MPNATGGRAGETARNSSLPPTVLIPSRPARPTERHCHPVRPQAVSFKLGAAACSAPARTIDTRRWAMGNLLVSGAAAVGGGKVVMADGSVRALSEPVSVAELMMDHPRHFVVDARVLKEQGRRQQQQRETQAGGGGAKVAPLPADHVLGAGGVYVLLPATRGKVSAEEARRALSAARSLARSRSMPGLRRKLSSSSSRKGLPTEKADESARHEAAAGATESSEEEEASARLDGFEEHRPEFLSRELSSRGWKPSLRTIEERVAPKKTPHWLF
ncbi:hypothetical protein BS78_01G380500 [Paspalum vaginatum]|nr:hypothetical protein BS78_01G380500 [Paspalum vaginatum]